MRKFLFILSAIALIGTTACKSKKKKEESKMPQGEVEVKVLCSGPEFQSDGKVFRANAVGESMDQATSKKRALANARADLASAINTTIKGTIDNYVSSREMNNREEISERFESLTREIINQRLVGTRIICERLTKTPNNNFKTYIAIELSGGDLVNSMNERLSRDERLRNDYDYERFKETFEREMEKLENSRR